jgi:glycosyltransferase involved in cell wall biosynthesis
MSTLYFPFYVPPVTGGDFVVIDHIKGLNKLGFDAKALYLQSDLGYLQFQVPVVSRAQLKSNDIVVVGEVHKQLFEQLRAIDCIKVLHNQNPYYTFYSFDTVQQVNDYPLTHIIAPSRFTKAKLAEMGITKPVCCVQPFIPSYFAPGTKKLQIAFSPNKRFSESNYVMGRFKSRYPEFANVPWASLTRMTRQDCAKIMSQSAIYAAFPLLEGLGLMGLEAMASGCQVVGYTGGGGAEYSTSSNGFWIDEGDHETFVLELKRCCDIARAGALAPHIERGLETARVYSEETFEAQLQDCYLNIMGSLADNFRLKA